MSSKEQWARLDPHHRDLVIYQLIQASKLTDRAITEAELNGLQSVADEWRANAKAHWAAISVLLEVVRDSGEPINDPESYMR